MKFPYDPIDKMRIGDRTVVVYKWDKLSPETSPPISKNVECFDLSGKRLWTVNGMERDPYWSSKPNMFAALKLVNSIYYLISFRGSSYKLDISNGSVIFEEFHK